MRGFQAIGKQVKDSSGEHFADCASDIAARLVVAALNWRSHRPVITDGEVICSRCQSVLPDEGAEPCVPRTPRCHDTLDLFGEADGPAEPEVQQVRTARKRGPERRPAVLPAPDRKRCKA